MRYAALLLLLLVGCKPEPLPFSQDVQLADRVLPMDTLNHGARFYRLHCAGCHGAKGDGKGEVGVTQIPKPRDVRLGSIKFASVRAGQLPTDADLGRILRGGLAGTGMQPWRFRDAEVDALVAYVKTLSPRWEKESAGTPIVPGTDPWVGQTASAMARGQAVFHGAGRCAQCHRLGEDGPAPLTPETPSAYGLLTAPDLRQGLRRSGSRAEDIYRTIAAGIGGTQMTAAVDTLSNADIWALVYWVNGAPQS